MRGLTIIYIVYSYKTIGTKICLFLDVTKKIVDKWNTYLQEYKFI